MPKTIENMYCEDCHAVTTPQPEHFGDETDYHCADCGSCNLVEACAICEQPESDCQCGAPTAMTA